MHTAPTNNGSDATAPGGDAVVVPGGEALTEYETFVLRHTDRTNIWIHVVSALMFWGGPIAALAWWSPWPLVSFFASGLMGAFGHWLTGDSYVNVRETTSTPNVVKFSSIMCVKFLAGRYQADIDAARAKAAQLGETA